MSISFAALHRVGQVGRRVLSQSESPKPCRLPPYEHTSPPCVSQPFALVSLHMGLGCHTPLSLRAVKGKRRGPLPGARMPSVLASATPCLLASDTLDCLRARRQSTPTTPPFVTEYHEGSSGSHAVPGTGSAFWFPPRSPSPMRVQGTPTPRESLGAYLSPARRYWTFVSTVSSTGSDRPCALGRYAVTVAITSRTMCFLWSSVRLSSEPICAISP